MAEPVAVNRDCFGLVGQQLDGKYDVESVVAEGGFGVVYKGAHRGLQKNVAIKVLKIPPEMTGRIRSEFLAKFALEARTIAKLDHPAIVRVLDFGACLMPKGEAAPWLVLEWLTGTTLERDLALRAAAPRSPSEVMTLLREVLEAMSLAHEEGVVHRDIKAANLMLVKGRKGDIHLKILDFGIAKLMGSEERSSSGQTATASVLHAFSLLSAAPEQLSGTRTGPWTDVHALALIISEMVTGKAPYSGADATEIYAAVLSAVRPTPAKHSYDAGAWELVLARAMSLKPAERYQDAGSFRDALAAEIPAVVLRRVAGPLVPVPAPRPASNPWVEPSAVTTLRPASKKSPAAGSASIAPRRSQVIFAAALAITGCMLGLLSFRLTGPQPRPLAVAHSQPSTPVVSVNAIVVPTVPLATASVPVALVVMDAGHPPVQPRLAPRVVVRRVVAAPVAPMLIRPPPPVPRVPTPRPLRNPREVPLE